MLHSAVSLRKHFLLSVVEYTQWTLNCIIFKQTHLDTFYI